jgi:hypothetical protein
VVIGFDRKQDIFDQPPVHAAVGDFGTEAAAVALCGSARDPLP